MKSLMNLADDMKLTSLTSISDFLNCAGITLPENIRLWARRNLAVARSSEVTPEEKTPCTESTCLSCLISSGKAITSNQLTLMEARRILDEELIWYGKC